MAVKQVFIEGLPATHTAVVKITETALKKYGKVWSTDGFINKPMTKLNGKIIWVRLLSPDSWQGRNGIYQFLGNSKWHLSRRTGVWFWKLEWLKSIEKIRGQNNGTS